MLRPIPYPCVLQNAVSFPEVCACDVEPARSVDMVSYNLFSLANRMGSTTMLWVHQGVFAGSFTQFRITDHTRNGAHLCLGMISGIVVFVEVFW